MGSFIFWMAEKSILEVKLEMVEAFKFGPHGGHAYFPLIRTKFSPGNKLQTMEKHLKEGLSMAFLDLQRLKKPQRAQIGSNGLTNLCVE